MPDKPTDKELRQRISELEAALAQSQKAEEALQYSERRLADIINFLPDATFAIDLEGKVTAWNRAIEELTGVKADDILGKGDFEYALCFYGIRRPVLIDLVLRPDEEIEKQYVYVKRKGNVLVSETQNPPFRKTPSHFWNSAGPLYDAAGKMVGAIEVIRDITEIKQVHQASQTREQLLQIYMEHTPAPVAMCDRDMRYLAVSQRWISQYDLQKEGLIGRCHYDVFPDLPERWKQEHQQVFAGERIYVEAELFKIAEDHEEWIKRELVPWRNAEGDIGGLIIFNELITEQRLATLALSAEKERLAVTLHSIGDAVITTDQQGRIDLMNPIAESLTGWSERDAVGRSLQTVFHIVNELDRKPCEDPVQLVIKKGAVVGLANNTILISKDGREHVIADSGAPIKDADGQIIGVVLVFRDATETRRIENEMMKIEKLESLGVLAGGLAHDFNNFLTGIVGNLSLAKLDLNPEDKIMAQLNDMEKAAMRAQELTQQLLTFSKGGEPIRRPILINRMVNESAQFALHGTNVRGEFIFTSEPLAAEVDEGQMTQVIHNLVLNGVQAMPEGGIIRIMGEKIELTANNVLSLPAGEYVSLSIQDRGTGIRREHLKYVFDPYFSTKQKGSGLGLAVVYSVINKHNGRITVDSELGKGTTFRIYLPAIGEAAIQTKTGVSPVATGSGSILVMDDEDYIRRLSEKMLAKIGYAATTASDGEEAIARYREAYESGRPFDAVILDLTVPGGMGGKEAIKRLLAIDPGVKAIVSSGYSNDPVMSNFGQYGFQAAIKKPYLIQQLSDSLQALLAKP